MDQTCYCSIRTIIETVVLKEETFEVIVLFYTPDVIFTEESHFRLMRCYFSTILMVAVLNSLYLKIQLCEEEVREVVLSRRIT